MISGEPGAAAADVARFQSEVAIPRALATGKFSRAAAFENLRPDEQRFPRKIDDFSHLTVYEIQNEDVAGAAVEANGLPAGAPGVRVTNRLVYRRYPRASQGRLTGRPTRGVFLILISPTERNLAQTLRDWADFVHIHYIAAATPPGYTVITPYESVDGRDPLYLHFYELDTDDPVAAVEGMTPAVCRYRGFEMGDEAFLRWAFTDSLDIWYVNVFRRLPPSPVPLPEGRGV